MLQSTAPTHNTTSLNGITFWYCWQLKWVVCWYCRKLTAKCSTNVTYVWNELKLSDGAEKKNRFLPPNLSPTSKSVKPGYDKINAILEKILFSRFRVHSLKLLCFAGSNTRRSIRRNIKLLDRPLKCAALWDVATNVRLFKFAEFRRLCSRVLFA